jgi:C-terminal processing protease CtpA/Prc
MLGVGLILEQQRDPGGRFVYSVGKCVPGSPAHRCGMIFEGDVLHSVSGTSVSVLSNDEMASLITGPEGSKVQLTFERNTLSTSRSKLTTVELERGSALDASSEIVGTVDRLQAEALLLKGDMDDLHAQVRCGTT